MATHVAYPAREQRWGNCRWIRVTQQVYISH